MSEACQHLRFPVVSGNVSFYNETEGVAIQPTPQIGGVGLIQNIDNIATSLFSKEDESLVLIGPTTGHLGSSIYLREIFKREDGPPPQVDLPQEKRNGDFVRKLIIDGRVRTCHDIADGGLYVAVAEMAMKSGIGVSLEVPNKIPIHAFLFGEDQGRYILAAEQKTSEEIVKEAQAQDIYALIIGKTGGNTLLVNGDCPIPLSKLISAYEGWMPEYMSKSNIEGNN
jgi:phosphoribosylformylglycinamidine synthase